MWIQIWKIRRDRTKNEASVGVIFFSGFRWASPLFLPCTDEGLSGAQRLGRLQLNVLLTVMDFMPQCVWQVGSGFQIYDKPWNIAPHSLTEMHKHTHTYMRVSSTYLDHRCSCHIRDASESSVRQPVVCTAVRLFSICERLSSLHPSHHKQSCLTASIFRRHQSKHVFFTYC